MDILFGEMAVHTFFIGAMCAISYIVFRGYTWGSFSYVKAFLLLAVITGYVAMFLVRHFLGVHATAGHHTTGISYALLASIHGVLSLFAIGYAYVVFVCARGAFASGINYFREHPKASIVLVSSWFVSLVSGFLIG